MLFTPEHTLLCTPECTTSGEHQNAPSGVQQIGALVRASV